MKQFLQLIRPFREMRNIVALCLVMVMTMGVAWGQTRAEVVAYTLEPAKGSNSSYTGSCDIAIEGVTWNLTGNSQMIPWRIGGKSISNVNRSLYSKTAISDNISKIEVTHGTASNINVNSWTLIVASDASFTNVVSTLTPTFTASNTTTINRPDGADWSNCYYKFVYNVSVTGSSNKYVEFTQAKFYKQEGSGPFVATPTFSPAGGDYITAQNVTLSCETQDAVIYYTTDGNTPDNTSTEYTGAITVSSTTTINAIAYVDNDASSVASATYTIVQPLSTMQAIFDKATEVGNTATNVYITLDDWVVSGVSTNGRNVFVTDGTKGFVIYDGGGNMGFTAGDVLSGTVYCKVQLYNGFAELTLLNSTTSGLSIATGGTVTAANVAMADLAGVNTGALVHYDNLTCSVDNNRYYLSDGITTLQVYNAIYAFGSTLVADHVYSITGVYQQYTTNNGETKEVLPRSADDIEEVVSAEPSVTVTPNTINAPAEGADGSLALTYENITDFSSFDYFFCDANGGELQVDPDWIDAEINEENDTYSLDYLIDANNGEARTAYIKVYTYDDNEEEVYAIVTVNQAQIVVDYATLPFEYDGNGTGTLPNGFTVSGLGTYSSSPAMKFDGTGDYAILKFNERPGTLSFNVKGNPSNNVWAGTFKVQTSENGTTYTDLGTYTNLTSTVQTEEFTNLGENVRYIKWIYEEKTSGNVALGDINLAAYTAPVLVASITVDPATVNMDADEHDGTLDLTYENLTITDMTDFDIQYYDAEGEETTEPAWIEVLVAEQDPSEGVGYVVSYYMVENESAEARTAYFKVYAMDDETNLVYSNLVTITQAAPVAPLTGNEYVLYTGALVEGDYIIYYDGSAMKNTVESGRLSYEEVTPNNDVITTDDATIVWHIAQSGNYWTIYSADAEAYAAGTGVKNKAQMLADGTDDLALWTVSGTEEYEFVNKGNSAVNVNAYLRNNVNNNTNYGFACYAVGTGGDLSLYKKVDSEEPVCGIVLDENNEWFEDFEIPGTSTAGLTGTTMGECWTWNRLVEVSAGDDDIVPQIYNKSDFAHSGNNSLLLWNRGVYAMPKLDESININELEMSFYVRQSYSFYTLLVGVMTDPTDPTTFEPVAHIDNGSSTGVEYAELSFANYPGEGRYIAFKNVRPAGSQYDGNWNDIHSVNYIDDIKLSKIVSDDCSAGIVPGQYSETFENVCPGIAIPQTGVEPACWEMVNNDVEIRLDKYPQVYYGEAYAADGNYSLRMADRCVYALPALAVSVTDITTLQLDMDVFQPSNCYQMQVGVWDEEDSTFVPVATVNNSVTTGYVHFTCNFSHYNGNGRRIAFRNTLNSGARYDYSYNYIDNIVLAEIASDNCSAGIVPGQYTEDFDNVCPNITVAQTGMEPDCWEMVQADVELRYDKYPQVYYSTSDSYVNSDHYSLRLADRCVYAMPALAEGYDVKDLTLTMWVAQPQYFYDLTVGVWEENENGGGTFVPVQKVNVSSEGEVVSVDFSNYGEGPGRRIAFRNTLNSGARYNYSYNYIDDIELNVTEAKIAESSSANVIDEIGVERYLEGIVVYPNPTVGELHIGAVDVQKVECYNQMGQLVAVYNNDRDINISTLAEGVYTLRITVPQGVTMRKVVKR